MTQEIMANLKKLNSDEKIVKEYFNLEKNSGNYKNYKNS